MAGQDSEVQQVLAGAWQRLMTEDPRVPPAVIHLTAGRSSSCASVGWRDDVPILQLNPRRRGWHLAGEQVMEWLIHHAVHGVVGPVAASEGRFHGRQYRDVAEDLGLEVSRRPNSPASTTLAPAEWRRYHSEIRVLEQALDAWDPAPQATRSSRNPIPAACPCGRKIRIQPSTLAAGPIICGNCKSTFTPVAPSSLDDRSG